MGQSQSISNRRRRAFSMVEATLSTVIVSGLMIAALSSVASSRLVRARMADRTRGQELAMDLMAEILQQTYADPASAESGRAAWTDVDDYNGLLDSPPTTKSGTALSDCTGWSRSVAVQSIDPITLAVTSKNNTGIKQITVTVSRGSLVLATVAAYRTAGWADTIPNPSTTTSEHPPLASATGTPLNGSGGQLTVNFSGAGSSDRDGHSLSYVWSFGDGSSGNGVSVSHSYAAAGNYTATLTVYDGFGGESMSSVNVTVTP